MSVFLYKNKAETVFLMIMSFIYNCMCYTWAADRRTLYVRVRDAQKTFQVSWVSQSALKADVYATTAALPYRECRSRLGN